MRGYAEPHPDAHPEEMAQEFGRTYVAILLALRRLKITREKTTICRKPVKPMKTANKLL